jgi:hypothetical protein
MQVEGVADDNEGNDYINGKSVMSVEEGEE